MIHAVITAVLCAAAVAAGLPWPFLFWPAAFYAGREHAQAEYRYIEANGRKRSLCPWWCGFAPSAWTSKGLLDFLLPLAVSLAACALQAFFWR